MWVLLLNTKTACTLDLQYPGNMAETLGVGEVVTSVTNGHSLLVVQVQCGEEILIVLQ